jgi:predicted amidophosphoribosyltransferase
LKNVRGTFRLRRRYPLDGASVLIVDDVMTTGATLVELARTLRKAGAVHVDAVVLARADLLE